MYDSINLMSVFKIPIKLSRSTEVLLALKADHDG